MINRNAFQLVALAASFLVSGYIVLGPMDSTSISGKPDLAKSQHQEIVTRAGARAPASISADLPSSNLSGKINSRAIEDQIQKIDKKRPLDPKLRALLVSRDVNPWERMLKLGMAARLNKDLYPDGDQVGGQVVEMMKQDPAGAMQAIESMMAKLPAKEFPLDRASLIDVAGDIPGMQEKAKGLAWDELKASVVETKNIPQNIWAEKFDAAMSSDNFDLLPMVSHSVLMRTSASPEEALRYTIDGMQIQNDPGIRGTLADQFVSHYPAYEQQLTSEMRRAQISMPQPQPN